MKTIEWIITILILTLLLPVFYLIFNVGNPNSIFRFIVKDPSYDIFFTTILSFAIGVLSFLLYMLRSRNISPLIVILNKNIDYIKKLKNEGKSDSEIAESFFNAIGRKRGLLYRLAKKRVLNYLTKI